MIGKCSICSNWKIVHQSRKTKELVCLSCHHKKLYKPPAEQCSFCQKIKPVHFQYAGLVGCENCYYQNFYRKHHTISELRQMDGNKYLLGESLHIRRRRNRRLNIPT